MTTTLRPSGPLQQSADGAKSRTYDVCVNSRPVGGIRLHTHPVFGPGVCVLSELRIDGPDRRRGRATVAALAAEEVARTWGCRRVEATVPEAATAALSLATALGYVERAREMRKPLTAPRQLPDGVRARRMTEDEYGQWARTHTAEYMQTLVRRGIRETEAQAKARADHEHLLPDGLHTPDTELYVLSGADGETTLGMLWLALQDAGGYVYEVKVDEAHRGRGHGRTLMLLAERLAAEHGKDAVGLTVFADNAPALRLYESLGYEPTAYYLYKQLL